MKHSSQLEDTHLVAAIITLNPTITATPTKTTSGRVAFELNKNDLSEEYQRLYSGESAPLKEYIRNLKEMRNMLFTLKSSY